MTFHMDRSRSVNSIRSMQRPMSRASTTSAAASPAPDLLSQDMFAQQQYIPSGPEAAILQYAHNQNGVVLDPVMQQQFAAQQMQATMDHYSRPYTPVDSQYMIQDPTFAQMQFAHAMAPGIEAEDRRRKSSAATATNDKELRELLAKNETRALKDVAQEVIQKERTPQAEKTKQLFAMLWLRKVCKPAKTSVPRNRVYSHYATRCGTERVVPLNPASFGKLVRVIFPGIQTRRLGVRGESKYHYVDLALCDEDESLPAALTGGPIDAQPELRRSVSSGAASEFASGPRLNPDTAAFPPPQPENRGPASSGRLFAYPDSRGMQRDSDGALMYEQTLRFPVKSYNEIGGDDSIALPSIHPYCPPKTDVDTAEALVALYRTHCTSLIDCIRFCKEKLFFHLFTSFHGTLTVPVQKLFSHPNLATWIQECDYLMYQKMARFVSHLTLQAAPPIVITIFNNISINLHAHISKTFQSHPAHVLQAKLKPAAVFASLLHRFIRVNAAAHAAANLLTVNQNREQMWREWVTMVNPKRVMEGELPDCGYEEVYKILTCDIRTLLEPLQAPPFPDNPMFSLDNQAYNASHNSFGLGNEALQGNENGAEISTETVLDRWATFLSALPARFPEASTRKLLHCIETIGTAALRDITIMGGASYQTWWVMKIFVDEMSLWLAAMGGFLERVPVGPRSAAATAKTTPITANGELPRSHSSLSGAVSRMSSVEGDVRQGQSQTTTQIKQHEHTGRRELSRSQSMHSVHSVHSVHDFAQSFDGSMTTNQMHSAAGPHPLSRPQSQPMMPQKQQQQQQQQVQLPFYPSPAKFNFDLETTNDSTTGQQQQQQQQPDFSSSTSSASQHQGQGPQQQHSQQKEDLDDSGICMTFTDDPFSPSKFAFISAHHHELLGSAGEQGVNVL